MSGNPEWWKIDSGRLEKMWGIKKETNEKKHQTNEQRGKKEEK